MDTLRYYERIGLLGGVERTPGGRRAYSESDVSWLGMLRCLRDTGMPIAEMLRFTELTRAGDVTVPDRLAVLEAHDERIEEQMALLRERQAQIRRKIDHYRAAVTPAADGR